MQIMKELSYTFEEVAAVITRTQQIDLFSLFEDKKLSFTKFLLVLLNTSGVICRILEQRVFNFLSFTALLFLVE